jgi:hypothetical protein
MKIKIITRTFSKIEYLPEITLSDEKVFKRIDIERKAVVNYRRKAFEEGKIEPMIHIIEKIQEAVKKGIETPAEKLETALELKPNASYDTFMKDFSLKFGDFSMELYGTDQDLRLESISRRGEIVPARLHNEDEMVLYRKYYLVNFNLPGCIEAINPNKFLRLKPIEEFPLLPLIPISPSTMKRWEDNLVYRKTEGYRFRIEKGRLYSSALVIGSFFAFMGLMYFLYKTDEESWVKLEKNRRKKQNKNIGLY